MIVDENNSGIDSSPGVEHSEGSNDAVADVNKTDIDKSEGISTGEVLGKEEIIYKKRFSSEEDKVRNATWKVLVRDYFQRYVKPDAVVVDLGAGDGNFIRNIRAKRRIAVDLSPHVRELEGKGIEVFQAPATELSQHLLNCPNPVQADVIFMSNFLEHLPTKHILLEVLAECHKVLGKNGKLLILQPNIRYVGPAYWDYIDHHIALTEDSLCEALTITGFKVQRLIPKFLPYTAKSKLGWASRGKLGIHLVEWYLKMPFVWRLLGKQTFVVARKE